MTLSERRSLPRKIASTRFFDNFFPRITIGRIIRFEFAERDGDGDG